MKNTELGLPARPPTDSEERVREALRACVEIVDKAGLLNLSNGVQLGQTSWYVKACDAFDRARAALGEARGTASASEPLDKTENSERGALRASLSGPHLRFDARGERVIQCWCGRHDLYSTSETVRGGGERHGFRHCYPVAAALGDRSGTALKAPLASSESAPPAPDLLRENRCGVCGRLTTECGRCTVPNYARDWPPDYNSISGCYRLGYERLLRENARLREELAKEKRYTLGAEERTKLTGDALQAEGDAHALREELTRARAAHLENAELLAKATEKVRVLEEALAAQDEENTRLTRERNTLAKDRAESYQRTLDEQGRRARAENENTPLKEGIAAAESAFRPLAEKASPLPWRSFGITVLDAEGNEVGEIYDSNQQGDVNMTLVLAAVNTMAATQPPADRKGDAAQPPSDVAADPGRVEGKKP